MKLLVITFSYLLTVNSVFSQIVDLTTIEEVTVKNVIDYLLENRMLELPDDTVIICTKEIQLSSNSDYFNHKKRTFQIVDTPGYVDHYCTLLLYHYKSPFEESRSLKFIVRMGGAYDGTLQLSWDRQKWNVDSDHTIYSVE